MLYLRWHLFRAVAWLLGFGYLAPPYSIVAAARRQCGITVIYGPPEMLAGLCDCPRCRAARNGTGADAK